jgi:hypothetical protein
VAWIRKELAAIFVPIKIKANLVSGHYKLQINFEI